MKSLLATLACLAVPAFAAAQHHTPLPEIAPASVRSIADGLFHAVTTWEGGIVPGPNDAASITHTVTLCGQCCDVDVSSITVRSGGSLVLSPTFTRLKVGTIQVLPGGSLLGGSPTSPVSGEIVFKPVPLGQDDIGCGLVVEGRCKLYGRAVARRWPRIAKRPVAGDTMIYTTQPPQGWKVGDQLLLPDTSGNTYTAQYLPIQRNQIRTVTEVTEEGVRFNPPLSATMAYPTELDGSYKYMGAIPNLTTSLVLRSEVPTGVRAHSMYAGTADIVLDGIGFHDMGRTKGGPLDPVTNRIGRYPIHLHMLTGPLAPNAPKHGVQFAVRNCVVLRSLKWPIAIHSASFGSVTDNVIWDADFDGIATETGDEWQTRIERNWIGLVRTGAGIWHRSRFCPTNGNFVHGAMGIGSPYGNESGGIYYEGLNRRQPGEPAPPANNAMIKYPKFPGAHMPADFFEIEWGTGQIAECRDNEFACTFGGVFLDHLKSSGWPHGQAQKHVVTNTVGWHGFGPPVTGYDTRGHHIDGMISREMINDFLLGTNATDIGTVWSRFNTHSTRNQPGMTINVPEGQIVIEDAVISAAKPVIITRGWYDVPSIYAPDPRGLHILFRRCRFTATSGGPDITIRDNPSAPPRGKFSVKVEDHNGVRGNNYTVEER